MKAIDILVDGDAFDDPAHIDVRRQRQLHQDAVHRRIGIQARDQFEHLRFGRIGRQGMVEGLHAAFLASLDLVAHIDLRGRIHAHQNDREPGLQTARAQGRDAFAKPQTQRLRERLAVDDLRAHAFSFMRHTWRG